MGILVDKNSKVIVQGMTGSEGAKHSRAMKEFGTQVVAGVTPGKGGQDFEGWPIYNSVAEDKEKHDPSDQGLGEDPAVINRTEPLPVRVEAHEHGADEQEDSDDSDDPRQCSGRTFHRGGGSVQSGSQLQLQSGLVRT